MPFFFGALWGALLPLLGSMVGRILLALGIGYVSFSGLNTLTDTLYEGMQSHLASMPGEILSFLGWLWVDKALSLIASAYTAALTIKLAGGAVLNKMIVKGRAP